MLAFKSPPWVKQSLVEERFKAILLMMLVMVITVMMMMILTIIFHFYLSSYVVCDLCANCVHEVCKLRYLFKTYMYE